MTIEYYDRIKIVRDSRDKFIEGATNAILSQVGFEKVDSENDYGADSLLNLAELSLKRNNITIPKNEISIQLR